MIDRTAIFGPSEVLDATQNATVKSQLVMFMLGKVALE